MIYYRYKHKGVIIMKKLSVEERAANKRAYDIKYRAENKNKEKLRLAKYYLENKAKVDAKNAKYYAENKEKEYLKVHPGKRF